MRAIRFFDIFLILLGITAAICLMPIGAGLVIASLISIVGIPIGVFILAAPTLFLLLLLARIFVLGLSLLPIHWSIRWLVSLLLSAGALALPPHFINRDLEERAAPLLAGDIDLISGPLDIETLAVVVPGRYDGAYSCDDFCQRALVNDQVGRIIMVQARPPVAEIDWSATGNAFWFERRDTCPTVELRDGIRNLRLPVKDTGLKGRSVSDLIRLKSVMGTCFVTGKAPLAEADAVIYSGQIKRGVSELEAGFNEGADTISANRSSLYLKQGDRFVTEYQATTVEIEELLPLYIPTRIFGYQFDNQPGLLRKPRYLGAPKPIYPNTPFSTFVTKVLGLSLAIADQELHDETRQSVENVLSGAGTISMSGMDSIGHFLEYTHRTDRLDDSDLTLALRILRDRRLPTSPYASAAVRKIPKNDFELAEAYAHTLFQRMQEFAPEPGNKPDAYQQLGWIAEAIHELPAEAIDPYFPQLQALARNGVNRSYAGPALSRLGELGAKSAPTLLFLIDDSHNPASKGWQSPYLAGMEGLCRMGALGVKEEDLVPELLLRLKDGRIVTSGSHWKLVVNTLFALGVDPEEMWQHLKSDVNGLTRKKYSRAIGRAIHQVDCTYPS